MAARQAVMNCVFVSWLIQTMLIGYVVADEYLDVRLVGGANNTSGRLEVRAAGGAWGTVCDKGFNHAAAVIACRSIGYNYGEKMRTYAFPRGIRYRPIWLDNVSCSGNESSLLQCSHGEWGNTYCTHYNDVGVVCDNYNEKLTLRLVDGINNSSGRLEVQAGGRWGTVCHDRFDNRAAFVACQSMGFSSGIAMWGGFERGSQMFPIWLDDVMCKGNESSLLHCSHRGWGIHNCYHSKDVGLTCDEEPVTPAGDLEVRFTGGPNNSSGRLEVRAGGQWGTVCENEFDQTAATVVCQRFGFNYGAPLQFGKGNASSPIWLDDVSCQGDESSLLQCAYVGWGLHNCDHSQDIGVICDNYDGNLVVRLSGGPNNSSGRLEVRAGGRWGTVCEDEFDQRAATVVCQDFGFNHGASLGAQFGKGNASSPIWLDDVSCQGNESSLLQCSYVGWGLHNCDHSQDVGVLCANYDGNLLVRLVGGPSNSSGRLEIKAGGRWGTVCGDGFDYRAANVVCNSIGFNSGVKLGSQLGKGVGGSVPMWLDKVKCTGNESSLLDCEHGGWGSAVCRRAKSVRIQCHAGLMVRLVGGPNNFTGRLEVKLDSKWGTVCRGSFDNRAAKVACRTMGYNYGLNRYRYPVRNVVGRNVPIWLDDVICLGNETSLLHCSHDGWGANNCYHYEDVFITCDDYDGNLTLRLVDGWDNSSGRLEVRAGGRWGTVCDDGFDHRGATVVCKGIGFDIGYVARNRFGAAVAGSDVPIWLSSVRCLGSETILLHCSHRGWGIHNCYLHDDVSIVCDDYDGNLTLRLVDGWNNSSGRLEVRAGGRWGTVCDDGFDNKGATVVCKGIGFDRGYIARDRFGAGYRQNGPTWLSNVRCLGNESSLLDCAHRRWGSYACTHYNRDVGIRCVNYNDLKVRLVGGPDYSSGRLEVQAGGRWGTVCGGRFTQTEAAVACKSIGYNYGIRLLRQFGRRNQSVPIWLVDISCQGDEINLLNCSHRGWGDQYCYYQDVSILCDNYDGNLMVRLVDGPNNSRGRLEVKAGGRWGNVCDHNFDNIDVTVACKSIGFNSGTKTENTFKAGANTNIPMWLVDVNCTGHESNLRGCQHPGWGSRFCSGKGYVNLVCGDLLVRLVDGPSNSSGQLQMNLGSGWGTVCDDTFDNRAATVTCRSVGFDSGLVLRNQFGRGLNESDPVWLDDVDCQGYESHLLACSHGGWGKHDCTHLEDVSVTCEVHHGDTMVRLSDGPNNASGRLEVKAGRTWGTVCRDHFDNRAARVACKSMGFNTGIALRRQQFGAGVNENVPIWLDNIQCTGNESSLLDCTHQSWGHHDCHHIEDVRLLCVGDLKVRLVNGPSNWSGRLEVMAGGDWGTVCFGLFDNQAASVVCKSIGYSYGMAAGNQFGSGADDVPIWLDDVSCNGDEASLLDCSHAEWGSHKCDHSADVSVTCVSTPSTAPPRSSLESKRSQGSVPWILFGVSLVVITGLVVTIVLVARHFICLRVLDETLTSDDDAGKDAVKFIKLPRARYTAEKDGSQASSSRGMTSDVTDGELTDQIQTATDDGPIELIELPLIYQEKERPQSDAVTRM